MGTRSTVKFYRDFESRQPILSIYQQYDGYINGVGNELAEWLKGKTIINGYNSSQKNENGYANGMGCLAAQYVADHKKEIGAFYITELNNIEEYNYEVRHNGKEFIIKVDDLFIGTPEELLNFTEEDEE